MDCFAGEDKRMLGRMDGVLAVVDGDDEEADNEEAREELEDAVLSEDNND